ncbi:hypothetical protein M413DRAFT_271443 [Hebeloma cylindrosporum]|uniref:MYND-type domain-containing protein n=1 Tax=Hebeloma cylindrosporum TaxID=76867 RepID=A0A0C3CT15_HEBCY|nr:hypothetical protein M413DRAFT_271443 [Hebeloma cylindrosporum h7]
MSRKTYEKCCHKKGVQWTEAWDPEEMWIQPNRVVTVQAPQSEKARETLAQQFEMMVNVNQDIADGTSDMTEADLISGVKAMTARMMDYFVESGHVDPGFAYAAKQVDFMPRPWTGGIPKVEQKIRMEEWNTAVDEYIASGVDRRTREDIENQSKIALGGGPLHPLCENEMCDEPHEGRTHYGGRPATKLLVCIGCKKTKYCSKECQRQAWGEHKGACKSGRAQEQLLSSQQAISQMHELMLENPMT